MSNPALPFKPQIVTGIYTAAAVADQNFIFSVDWEIDASFRGMHASTLQGAAESADIITHVVYNDKVPYVQQNMHSAVALKDILVRAPINQNITLPPSTSALCIQYQSAVDLWQIVGYRNYSASDQVVPITGGTYYVVDLLLCSRFHFGKGDTTSDPIYISGAVDETVSQTVFNVNMYVSGSAFDFICV